MSEARAPVRFSEELGREICARIAAGESEHAVARSPGMPCRRSIRDWALREPGFGAALAQAKLTARMARLAQDRAVEAQKLWRRALRRQIDRKGGRASTYNARTASRILGRVASGESVLSIGADPDMPCAGTIYKWLRQQDEFRELYGEAKDMAADVLFDVAWEICLEATEATVKSDSLRVSTLKWRTALLAPRKYGPLRLAEAPEEPVEVVVRQFFKPITEEEREATREEKRRLAAAQPYHGGPRSEWV